MLPRWWGKGILIITLQAGLNVTTILGEAFDQVNNMLLSIVKI